MLTQDLVNHPFVRGDKIFLIKIKSIVTPTNYSFGYNNLMMGICLGRGNQA